MNTKGLRFRLTFWFTVSLIVATFIIFTSFYFVTRRMLHAQTDNTLIFHSREIHDNIVGGTLTEDLSNIPGLFVVILNNNGTIISSSQTISPKDGVIRELFEAISRSRNPYFTDRTLGSQKLRFLATPVMVNGSFRGAIIMGHPIDAIQNALNSLITMLGIVLLILVFPAILGGYLNARSAVGPISDISKKLKQINLGSLDKRVDNPQTGDEIEELSVTFNSLLDRLHKAFQRERQFIGDVAHEVKTPLAAQRTNIELVLAKDHPKKEYRLALEESLIDNNRLSTTLKNVLDLAWSQADAVRTQFEDFDLSRVATEIKDLCTKMAVGKQISVTGNIESNIVISGKKDKLERALVNLVDNAVKYTPKKGKITITLQKVADKAQFKINDSGRGISESDLPHVFERFYRGSISDKTFGSGLGLSISQAIVSAHHGEILAKSQIGVGSEFTVLLPTSSTKS